MSKCLKTKPTRCFHDNASSNCTINIKTQNKKKQFLSGAECYMLFYKHALFKNKTKNKIRKYFCLQHFNTRLLSFMLCSSPFLIHLEGCNTKDLLGLQTWILILLKWMARDGKNAHLRKITQKGSHSSFSCLDITSDARHQASIALIL